MKKIILLVGMLAVLAICLWGFGNENWGFGNENWGFGNYSFTHIHYSDGVQGQCAKVDSWHDNELGCEVHTPNGTIYVSEGTYQLFEKAEICPYCGG